MMNVFENYKDKFLLKVGHLNIYLLTNLRVEVVVYYFSPSQLIPICSNFFVQEQNWVTLGEQVHVF